MPRLLRTLFAYTLVVLVASCSGGSGCSSCLGGATAPIPGEYPISPTDNRIPHSIQVRLTHQGLADVAAMGPDLFAGFLGSGITVPPTPGEMDGFYFNICTGAPCTLHVALTNGTAPDPPGLQLGFGAPDQITAQIHLIITGDVIVEGCPTLGCSSTCGGFFCITSTDTIHIDTHGADGTADDRDYIGLETNIAIARDTHAQRLNYHRADLVSPTGSGAVVQQIASEAIETTDVYCSSGSLCFLVNLLASTIVSQISSELNAAVGPIQNALSDAQTDGTLCPTGTTLTSGYCTYPDHTNVPTLLGTQASGNLGALLNSITPGLQSLDSYDIASGDPTANAEIVNGGMSLDIYGAVTSNHHSTCVPMLTPPALPTIPEWMNLRQDMIPGTTITTDLGIGVSQDFMNSALWNLWDSGMFCLGVTTRTSQMLSTGLFGAVPQLAALRNVIFPSLTSAAAIVLRPQTPPTVVVGGGTSITTDPLLTLTFHSLALDFYAWSEERYVRFMTVNTDLALPVDLMQDMGGLLPVLGMGTTSNVSITNGQLLNANAMVLSMEVSPVLGALLGTAISMAAGSLPAINLPSIPLPAPSGGTSPGSVVINIPANGITGLAEGMSRYLAIFADLTYMHGAHADTAQADTTATVEPLPFDAHVYDFGPGFTPDQLPRMRLHLAASGNFGHAVEYTYRFDDLTWSQWTTDSVVDATSPSFIFQGSHYVDVRARIAGAPNSVDTTPARVAFIIDTTAPTVTVAQHDGQLMVIGHDDVTTPDRLQYAIGFDNSPNDDDFSSTGIAPIPNGAVSYTVAVRDESGNTGHSTGSVARQPQVPELIRGGPSTNASSGCSCSTPGGSGERTNGLLGAIVAGFFTMLAVRRRRSRSVEPAVIRVREEAALRGRLAPTLLFWTVLVLCFAGFGCTCSGHTTGDGGPNMDGGSDGQDVMMPSDVSMSCPTGMMFCSATSHCVASTETCDMVCPPGQAAQGSAHFNPATCTWDVSDAASGCNCQDLAALPEGEAGSHLHMAVGSDGTIWFSAYSEGDPPSGLAYGDLIVGQWATEMSAVSWTQVDGVGAPATITGATNGWRGGNSALGDDVGRWNSIALDASNHPHVSYWDKTHDQLKYASFDGTSWHTQAVDTNGSNGRYTSLVLLPGGIPAISYRAIVPDAMMAGHVNAQVRYAVAHSATPMTSADWTITNVATAPTSCRASNCATGQVCVESTGVCTAPSGTCSTACSATQACIASACADLYTANWIEDYPPGIGLFTSLRLNASNVPQLVYYDRDRGNLMGTSLSGATWATPFIIDGQAAGGADTGDRGMWASLAVTTDGVWHIAYVDAWAESVLYTTVTGTTPATPETVDNGQGVGTTPFTDGQHVIGDSLALDIDSTNIVRVSYGDSTVGQLRVARRGASGWTVTTVDMTNSTGYWSQVRGGNVATFWRNPPMDQFGVRVFPAP